MRRWTFVARTGLVLLLMATMVIAARSTRAGEPLYPDLRTSPPSSLSLEPTRLDDGRTHYLLRFDNLVGNYGGRLEIVADLETNRDLFQNVYDAPVGGILVSHTKVNSDLIFHPTHNHFHFQGFATYLLLQKDTKGIYRQTTRRGEKTSFCILDTVKVQPSGTSNPSYTNCNNKKQGLSAGWGDIYTAVLPDQWIDTGTTKLVDGDYAIESITDPDNKLVESNDANNAATTYFSISQGKIVIGSQLPTCNVSPAQGPVGTPVTLYCSGLAAGETVDISWGSPNATILATSTADASGVASANLTIPPSTLGAHYFFATSQVTNQSTLGLFMTTASLQVTPGAGGVGSSLQIVASGFTAQEEVAVRVTTTGSTTVLVATLIADARGTAAGTAIVPPSTFGPHAVTAKGGDSRASAQATYSVTPTMTLIPSSIAAGGKVSPSLRGFKKYEYVSFTLSGSTTVLKKIRTSSTGSANATSGNAFAIPANLTPGEYTIVGTGSLGSGTVTALVTVTGPQQTLTNRAPAATATTVPPSATTATPTATATSVPTDEPTAMPSPTATAQPTETAVPTETPTLEPAPTDAVDVPAETTETPES